MVLMHKNTVGSLENATFNRNYICPEGLRFYWPRFNYSRCVVINNYAEQFILHWKSTALTHTPY